MKYLEVIEKKDKGDLPVVKRTVAVVVFYDGEGKVLLQDRKSISKAGELWGLFGGGLENGETPEQALKRELTEEIADLPNDLEFEKIGEMKVFYFNKKENFYRELYKHVFTSKIQSKLKIKVLEGDGAKWFSFAQAKKQKMIPGNVEAIGWVQNENRK